MSAARNIAKNAILLYVARVIGTLLKFVLFIYIARTLGDAELGKFTFAIVFTTFFSAFTSLGMDDLLVREVARDKVAAGKYLGNMVAMKIVFSIIVLALIAGLVYLMGYPADTRAVVIIFAGYAVLSSLSNLYRANFRAFEKMEWDALVEVIESVIVISAGLWLLFAGFSLIEVSLAFLFAAMVNLTFSFVVCTAKFTKTRLGFQPEFATGILKDSIPFFVSLLFILYTRVDTVMLSAIKGDAVVGSYNAAYQIVLAFDPLALTFMMAVVPVISRYFVSSRLMMQIAYEKSFKYLTIIGFPVSVGGMVLADRIIPLLYGPGFNNSILALQILIWNILLSCMNRPMLFTLGAVNRQGTGAVIALLAIAGSFGLNYAVIPHWSYIGSGVTSLVIGGLVTAASWYALSRYAHSLPIIRISFRPLVASLVMGGIVYAMNVLAKANLLLLILLGAGIYLVVLYFTGGLSADDRYLFREALRLGGGQMKSKARSV